MAENNEAITTLQEKEALDQFIALGVPVRRHLNHGESVSVPGYEFLGVRVSGERLEVLEFPGGEICPVIPNAEGLHRAIFSLIVLNRDISYTAEHLRFVRRSLGYTQEKLADAISVQRQTICAYEKGTRQFDKSVEFAVRFIALPTALNYLPADLRQRLGNLLGKLQDFYAQLDELVIPADSFRSEDSVGAGTSKDLGTFLVMLPDLGPRTHLSPC